MSGAMLKIFIIGWHEHQVINQNGFLDITALEWGLKGL